MKKMNTNTKKIITIIENFVVFVFIFLFCFSNIFSHAVADLDEIWNYNFARNIANGLVPYNDFNMIQTPLLPIICALFLKIISDKLIVMRILAVIMQTVIFYLGFEIIKKHTKNSGFAILSIVGLLIIFKDIFTIDYNYAVMLVGLIAFAIELNHLTDSYYFKQSFKYHFLIGILVGTAILFKHTTGLVLCIGALGYRLFAVRSKEDFKGFIKLFFTRLLGVMVPLLILVIYLLLTRSFINFIDYAILGVKHFSNVILYKTLLEIEYVKVFAIVVPLIIVYLFITQFIKNNKQKNIMFGYSLASFAVAFPISDKIHFMIGSFISVLSAAILIMLFIDEGLSTEKLKKFVYAMISFVSIFVLLMIGYRTIINIDKNYIKKNKETELNHFEGTVESKFIKSYIKSIDEFILEEEAEGNKVYILDAEAAIFFIPLDRYNKNYDMFMLGNLGKDGEARYNRKN